MVLGRLFHYGFDALAISVVLAGVKRSTGLGCVGTVGGRRDVEFALLHQRLTHSTDCRL